MHNISDTRFIQSSFRLPASDEVSRLRFEKRVLVADFDKLAVAGASFVGHASQVRVALLTVFAHHLNAPKSISYQTSDHFTNGNIDGKGLG